MTGRANPRWPRHSHHDATVGTTWELKDTLPAKRNVYYGKLLKGRPVLVALDLFPAFYALVRGRQRARDYVAEYQAGRLSLTGKRLMDLLIKDHPRYTRALRAESFMLEPSRTREFERAIAELQQGLWIVKTEERYEPSFSYRWDLLEAWLPDAVSAGRRIGRGEAVKQIVSRYLSAAVYSTPRLITRLFSLSREEVETAIVGLQSSGRLLTGVAEPWVVDRRAVGQSR
ncbi:MAG TPA: crosslink repair DNA glycosylase YcaQ family protein [Methylomirabilota bacterium]|nr:crosslink repair DNA glycosylase YcaQ family protein [Methylomirabilota bacterium]